jgi:hypothetical protein
MSQSVQKTDSPGLDELTRPELEQRLKAKSDAITGRFEHIESKLPSRLPTVLSAVKKGAKSKVGIAVGAGLLVGMVLFRRKTHPKQIDYDDGLTHLSHQLAARVAELLRKGKDSDEAVRRAFEEQPPLMRLSPESEGILKTVIKQAFQAGVGLLGSELADYLRKRAKEKQSS